MAAVRAGVPPGLARIALGAMLVLATLAGQSAAARQAAPSPAATSAQLPWAPVATTEARLPPGGDAVIWRVQIDPPRDDPQALRLVLPERDLPRMHGEHGAFRRSLSRPRQTGLAPGEPVSLSRAGIDALSLGVSLVPATAPANPLPAGVLTSTRFPLPDDGARTLMLRQGVLDGGEQAALPAPDAPMLLVALDAPVTIAFPSGTSVPLTRGDILLIDQPVLVQNPGRASATVAAIALEPTIAGAEGQNAPRASAREAPDPALAAAWQRHGCPGNPGTPACLVVSMAAACDLGQVAPGCMADSDRDSCHDTAEVRAGFDPFDGTDCLAGGDGAPLLNCLFPAGGLACDGTASHTIRPACVTADAAGPPDCPPATPPRVFDCGAFDRDPECDGFAPHAP